MPTDSRGSQPAAPGYRPDIDGLRAIAVMAVVVYHADPRRAPGGFIGVDVFFVISGYLISGLLLKQLRQGGFSYWEFYARRIRRLFPALAIVILSALIMGWVLLPAAAFAGLGRHVVAGCLFVSNLALWQETSYFDTAARLKPLLHLWSLGVEEQFYIVWPWLLFWAWRRGRSLIVIISALLVASFALNVSEVGSHEAAAFYSPFSRFWELMCGCLLVALEGHAPRPPPSRRAWQGEFAAVTGLALIAVGIATVNVHSPFPGWWALLPTAGTTLIIAAGPAAWVNRALLSNRLCVFLGNISYPLYLWHWILLVFMAAMTIETRNSVAAVVGLAVLLAGLTFLIVERPIRARASARAIAPVLLLIMGLLAIAGGVVFGSGGVPGRFSADANALGSPLDAESSYRYRRCFVDTQQQDQSAFAPECLDSSRSGQTLVLLWGDSHAAHLYPGLRALQQQVPFRLVQLTATACPPLIGPDQGSVGSCAQVDRFVREQIRLLRPAIVILGDRWSRDWTSLPQSLQATADFLRANGVRQIFAIGSPPRWDPSLPTSMFWFYRDRGFVPQRMQPDTAGFSAARTMDGELAHWSALAGVRYISALDALCNPRGCLTLVAAPPAGLISPDYDHFSELGSSWFIDAIHSSGALAW